MSIEQFLSHFEYPTCRRPTHFEELSMVCLDRKCSSSVLICPICEDSAHRGHLVVPLRQFLQDMAKMSDQQTVKVALQLQTELNILRASFAAEIGKVREDFQSSLYELEVKVDMYFNQINQKCYESFRTRKEEHIAASLQSYSAGNKVEELGQLIEALKRYRNYSIEEELRYYKESTKKKLASLATVLGKLTFQSDLKCAKEMLRVSPHVFSEVRYDWSASRSPSIEINGSIATQKASSSNGERFALLESTNGAAGDIKVRFRIRKLKGWIGVGICLKELIVTAGFKFNYTLPFHGSYLISANGYSWSHSRPEYNAAYKSFIYHEGDIIEVSYCALEDKVTFENKQNSSKFLLSTVPLDASQSDYYVPCVNLCNAGDEIEVVNDVQ